jgi:uncharacterized protein DUF4338
MQFIQAADRRTDGSGGGAGMTYTFPDLVFEFCSREDPRYREVRDLHYVENRGAHAQQIHFLIFYKRTMAGIISGGSAAYAVASRDTFFAITKENRKKVLNGVIDNTVFRLVKNEPNLSTRVIALWRKVIPLVWDYLYGVPVFGFETFVVEEDHRKGSLYKADNWTFVGETSGSSKSHKNGLTGELTRKTVAPKLAFCKWRDGYSAPVESEYVSSWRGKTPEEKQRRKTIAERRNDLMGKVFYTRNSHSLNNVCFTSRQNLLPAATLDRNSSKIPVRAVRAAKRRKEFVKS